MSNKVTKIKIGIKDLKGVLDNVVRAGVEVF